VDSLSLWQKDLGPFSLQLFNNFLFLILIPFLLNFNLLTFVVIFSYRPGISSQFVKETLAFVDVEKCVEWLTALGVVFLSTDKENIDCKTSMSALTAL